MFYINALELLNECVRHSIIHEENGLLLIFRDKIGDLDAGWHLEDKDVTAKELMLDLEGQKLLIAALKEKGIEFTPKVVLSSERRES